MQQNYNPLEHIDTHGLTYQDFIRYRMSTVTPKSFQCSNCGAKIGIKCTEFDDKGYCTERRQLLWDKCRDVKEFVTATGKYENWQENQ